MSSPGPEDVARMQRFAEGVRHMRGRERDYQELTVECLLRNSRLILDSPGREHWALARDALESCRDVVREVFRFPPGHRATADECETNLQQRLERLLHESRLLTTG